ncbi:MAG: hypothetical protein LUD72_00975 [Bacteroidales bacterium]|nr:hypothetical protein [Bacteroidales bacterium]
MRRGLLEELEKKYSVYPSMFNKHIYGVLGDKYKLNNFMGAVEKRKDGWHFCPFDIHLNRYDQPIKTVEDFEENARQYKEYWECRGLTTDVGNEVYKHSYRMTVALSLLLDRINAKKGSAECGINGRWLQRTAVDNVVIDYGEGENENVFDVGILLGGQRAIMESFTDMEKMLKYVGEVFGLLALEKVYPLIGAIDRLSKDGFMSEKIGNAVVTQLNLNTLDAEKCTLREYMVEKLEEGIKALKEE